MTKTILIVEDETDILHLVEYHLKAEGYTVLAAQDGIKGLDLAIEQLPDLIVLDLMLPGMDGLEVCKALKRNSKTENIPVVMLTAKGEEVDRIVGLELGADDYIVKPFSPRELTLRIRAILKRFDREPAEETQLQYLDLKIDLDSYKVWIEENEISLTVTEFNLLLELVQNQGRVRTRDQLLDRVWGYQFDGYARTVDTHVRRLRKKIGSYADAIETVRGIGYRFKEE
ncbi:MAG: response regulator [Desulfobacteraceae bacterium]|nr:response regulator [Desulfobacteraceae bacterium]MBC2754385.1 response regulator [Desulfobacteraceae bacterium]